MPKRGSLSKSIWVAAILWAIVVGLPLLLIPLAGISPFWALGGAVIALIYTSTTLASYIVSAAAKNKKPAHERMTVIRKWQSELGPQEVLDRITREFQNESTAIAADSGSIRLDFGSDAEFRKWGGGFERGMRELPMVLSVKVETDGDGSQVTGEARDDLGWYLGRLVAGLEPEAIKRLRGLLGRAEHVTTSEARMQ